MSDSETFLARWARLKREAAASGGDKDIPAEMAQVSLASDVPVFDPNSVPAIDLIDAATDIRPFLQDCVPEELTRAALRTTWTVDPAIREFIGIAESQWDFNEPGSIPGFGTLTAAESLDALAALGALRPVGDAGVASGSLEAIVPPVIEGLPSASEAAGITTDQVSAVLSEPACDVQVPVPRRHGSALPN